MSVPKIKLNGKVVTLNQNHYKASGGEGAIYVKDTTAYKIYHEPKKVIPVGKIKELGALANMANVLGPIGPITDLNDNPVGFAMRYVDKTEFLCKMFSRAFRDANGIGPNQINLLVKRMQDTLKTIHSKNILVVDYNELNFLTNQTFDEVFHIDVDSYQTPNYKASALMESVRDRKVQNNQFTTFSDWFSFGVVAFQMYMGTHPYKGRHPDFGKDWVKMMDEGISVFNKACRMPPNVQNWDVIPKGHLKWFEKVFEHGERIAPPEPEQVTLNAAIPVVQIIKGTDKLDLTLVRTYEGDILATRFINGSNYTYTTNAVYADGRKLSEHGALGFTDRRTKKDFLFVQSDTPALIGFNRIREELEYEFLSTKSGAKMESDGFFIANDKMYKVASDSLVEYSFMKLGVKPLASQQIIGNVFSTHQIYDGMVVQDMLGTCRLAIPYKTGVCTTVHVKELDGTKVVSAKYERGFAIIVVNQDQQYNRYTIKFNQNHTTYEFRKEENVSVQEVQFVVLDKGICVAANGDTLEIFMDVDKYKVISNSPITDKQKLLSFGNEIFVTNKNELYKLKMK